MYTLFVSNIIERKTVKTLYSKTFPLRKLKGPKKNPFWEFSRSFRYFRRKTCYFYLFLIYSGKFMRKSNFLNFWSFFTHKRWVWGVWPVRQSWSPHQDNGHRWRLQFNTYSILLMTTTFAFQRHLISLLQINLLPVINNFAERNKSTFLAV